MSDQYSYHTIDKPAIARFKDRGSKFIAYAFPIQSTQEFKKRLDEIKKEHPKATHHCFAYRIGTDGNNFRVSDAGEPSGTAGRPILGQIDSRQITNVSIIVVRYFGGTLLGVPGLINAYKTAAGFALQLTPIIKRPVEVIYQLQFDYTRMNEVMTLVRQYDCRIIEQDMQLFCRLKIGVPKIKLEEILAKFQDLHSVEVTAA